ncbi:TetR/AcrR family transcriptional regulator [Paractinoplanes toevensis]|uniref:TetR family transcriptional regulator n=1 Tax=Paractinoplanes toevensis TaxID=571911 RepID=A0A919TD06_9ACTN|nr:TetR/AcrR family transcriptional regulator [Actinoplanes toevensis]GIM93744.1 TetR family transcriptional regulator [Actinoplanes toevensis]
MEGVRDDARRNRERILEVARVAVREQGTQTSLREIARRAEVGMGTLYRHFPSREALLDQLTHRRFDHLGKRAAQLANAADPAGALTAWLTEFAYGCAAYRGLPDEILATFADETSSLHPACVDLQNAVQRLLTAAQAAGAIRPDLTAGELFALVAAVAWIAEQAPIARERLLDLILSGLEQPAR